MKRIMVSLRYGVHINIYHIYISLHHIYIHIFILYIYVYIHVYIHSISSIVVYSSKFDVEEESSLISS